MVDNGTITTMEEWRDFGHAFFLFTVGDNFLEVDDGQYSNGASCRSRGSI